MADDQRHGHIFGVLFIITFITSIAALALYQPVLDPGRPPFPARGARAVGPGRRRVLR